MDRLTNGGRLKILVGACGSVAVLNLPQYLTEMKVRLNAETTVIMTEAAETFIGARSIRFFCDQVIESNNSLSVENSHIPLAMNCDVLVVLPASANTLSLAAAGSAATPLLSTILACPSPILFFPNMNALMWSSKAVQRNVAILEDDGRIVVKPTMRDGLEVGTGTHRPGAVLPQPEECCAEIERAVNERFIK